jgi:nucleotide-binding universal stress UspA family protein
MNASLTTILLATDGSSDAALAGQAAADISRKTGAQLHVVTSGLTYHPRRIRPWCSTTTPARPKRKPESC